MFPHRKLFFSAESEPHLYQNLRVPSRKYSTNLLTAPSPAMNTRILTVTFLFLACTTVEAGLFSKCGSAKNRRAQRACVKARSQGPTTNLWKGKDGEIRQVISYWAALHRSVDAEKLELDLAGVQSELETSQAELVALQGKAAADKASFEQQIAKLKTQLGKQRKLAASQNQRAEKAEAAHTKSVSQVASLRETGKKTQTILTKVQNDLKQTAADRDKLTAANAQLQKDMADMTAAKDEATAAVQAAQAEIKKMKQDALEAKKAAVVKENAEYEKDPPKDDDAVSEEKSADEEKPEVVNN